MAKKDKIKILILDDDFTIREILKSLLLRTLRNVSITTSDNGVKGLGLIELKNPDLLIVDSTLPEFAGAELVNTLKNKSSFTNARKIALLHEDEHFPQINDPSLVMFNKDDNNFIEKFVTYLSYSFSIDSKPTQRHSLQNTLAEKALKVSNRCDVLMHKISKTRSILNPLRWTIWMFNQVYLSFILTIFYLSSGGKIREGDEADSKYLTAYRVRYYPTLTTLIIGLIILLFQVGVFIASGFAVLHSNLSFLVAQTACPLPGAPSIINTQVIVSPDNIDGIIDCAALDIIVGPTGEIVMERHVIQNNYTNGDWGVTLLVNNLTVQEGGKITADGKGYTVLESESVGRGGDSAGQSGGAGGGHGGAGGQGVEDASNPSGFGGTAYGNNEAPTTLGSSGGNGGGIIESFQHDWLTNERFNALGTSFSSGIHTGSTTGLELQSEVIQDVITDGLISYWKLDEENGQDLNNEINGAANGILGADNSVNTDDPIFTSEEGCKNNGCLTLDGIDDYVTLGSIDLNEESFTISSWFKTESSSSDQSLITLTNTNLPGLSINVIASDDLTNPNKLSFLYRSPSGSEGGQSIYSTNSITDNQWHHFAATFNSTGEIRLFIDGNLEGTIATTGTLDVMDVIAGRAGPSDASNYYKGSIDDIRIYNTLVSDSDIQEIFEFTPGMLYSSGEQTWLSETIGDGNSESILVTSITVDWALDGSDNIAPRFQILGSQTGTFTGEESVYPASGVFYQNGGTYNINDNIQKNTTEINGYFKFWKVRAILNTGSNLEDTPRISGITLVGNSQESGSALGGAGGGAIRIVSTGALVVNGSISANGLNGQAQGIISGGGGSGGSIWIEANTFSGNGIVEAKGGIGEEVQYQGGGGGGGRLVMLCISGNSFSGDANVNPGVTAYSQDGGVGTIIGPTCRPNDPGVLKQYRTDQVTEIGVGGTTTQTSVYFVSELSDVDTTETLSLQLEIRPLGVNFTNVPNHIQPSPMSNPQPCTNAAVNCGKILVNNLDRSTEYHWQVRVRDSRGGYSNWVSFGANDESARDFRVTGNPATLQVVEGNNQSGTVNSELATPLVVRVIDAQGFPVPEYTINWSVINSGVGGGFVGGNAITDTDGYSSRQYRLGTKTGTNIVRAGASGLSGNPIDFNFTGIPDAIHSFAVTAPQFGITSQDFGPVTVTAYDQYNNVKTDYSGNPTVEAVKSLDESVATGVLTPTSINFVSENNGVLIFNNFNHNTLESIKIKITDGSAIGLSNSVAIVDTLGSCPDLDGIIDVDQTWTADINNQGIFDCRGINIVIQDESILTLVPYNNGNNQIVDDYGVTILTDNLSVENGSSIVSNGRGYTAATIYGTISYGGYGTTGGVPYGSVYEPKDLGASGSSGNAGGGAIKLVVSGTTDILGSISANGNNPNNPSCGAAAGAGGSIWIETSIMNGTGFISANGSSLYNCGSAYPSGGRIALYYSTGNYISNAGAELMNLVQARGGGGGPGTIYIEQVGTDPLHGAKLYVDNNGSSSGSAAIIEGTYEFSEINLTRYGHINIMGQNSELKVPVSTSLKGDSTSPTLSTEGTFTYYGEDTLEINGVNVDIRGEILLDLVDDIRIGNTVAGALTLRAKTWAHDNNHQYTFGDINVDALGMLNLVSHDDGVSGTSGDYGVTVNAINLTVATGGRVSADNNGYDSGTTSGKSLAYGGYSTTGVVPYGDVFQPVDLGAAGGASGNRGGGAMHLVIGNALTVEGSITSTGGSAVTGSCGRAAGSGGSVWIETFQLNGSGAGIISANGSAQTNCSNAHPSGGRVAIYYSEGDYFNNIGDVNITDFVQARGLAGGGPGTIYIEHLGVDPVKGANLYVDNANSNGRSAGLIEGSYEFQQIKLTRYGHVTVMGNNSILTVNDGLSIKGDNTSPDLAVAGTFRYTGEEELYINGVDVDIQGEILLVNGIDFTVGNTSIGGMILRASTWAHNKENQYTFGDVTVGPSGVITLVSTHDGIAGTVNDYGVTLNTTNLEVQAGGLITADNHGYTSERSIGYGGYGTNGAVPYGNVYEPTDLGAVGSSGNNGGGAIKLNVSNTLTLNGTISSVGGSAVTGSCGRVAGTGGSIWINTNNLSSEGTSGIVRANGSTQYNCSGIYPSGGRVAIYYNDGDYFENIGSANITDFVQARGLSGGGPGTIYIEQTGVDPVKGAKLYVDNAGANGWSAGLVEGDYAFEQIALTRYGHLTVLGDNSLLSVNNGASLKGDSTSPNLAVAGTFEYTGEEVLSINGVKIDIQGEILLENGDDFNLGTSLAGGLTLRAKTWAHDNTNQYTFGDINIGQFGTMSLVSFDDGLSGTTGDYGVYLTADNINISTGGIISADNLGYNSGNTAGKAISYGGYGTNGALPYGSVYQPRDLGAAGGVGGNRGGGAIRLKVNNTLTVDGIISSLGGASVTGSCGRAGAAGGSIWIEAGQLNSTATPGLIRANGTGQYNCSGIYPSGGRVAIYYTGGNYFTNIGSANPTDYVQARGGSGGPGTIYIEQLEVDEPFGAKLYVDNAGNNSWRAGLEAGNYQFNQITLTRYGNVELLGTGSVLTVTTGASLKGDNTSPDFTIGGTFLYTGEDKLFINGMDIDINGDIQLVNGDDFTLGNTSAGGMILRAKTWAHDNNTPYAFGNITIGQYGVLSLTSHDDGISGTDGDYGTHILAENIDLKTGGIITADNRGYGSGNTAGKYMSYGGYANGGNQPYGDIYEPKDLGAPGGVGGNNGGGSMKLTVSDTFNLNGIITSAGGASVTGSCGRTGGSGGSIWIDTNTLNSTGTTGLVRANGTAQYNCGGGYPSGGRVAIYYTEGNYFTNLGSNPVYSYIYARGGGGGPGTVYIENKGVVNPKSGDLYIDNGGAGGTAMQFDAIDYNFNNVYFGTNVSSTMKQDLLALRSNESLSIEANVENIGDALAIWNFEESSDGSCSGGGDYCDTSGNSRNLTSFGSQRVTDGKVGNALELDGSNYAEVNTAGLTPGSFTVGMWAKLDQFTANNSNAQELINFNDIATTSSLDIDVSRNLRFEWPSKLVTGNLSAGRTVTMSSTLSSFTGSLCVDGNLSNFCHTNATMGEWVQIDLGSTRNITKVDIWNRLDCCQDRLKTFKIEVSTTGSFSGEQVLVGNYVNETVGRPSTYTFESTSGRYLRITNLQATNINLAEIEVYETASYLPETQWQHIVATYDATTGFRRIYVDGVKVTEANQGTNYSIPISKISIGKGGLGSSTGFVGLIDEIFLYPRALNETEINIYRNNQSWNEFNDKRGRGPVFNLTGNFTLETGAVLNAKALGFPSEVGPGSGTRGIGQSGGAGGGHGGSGGQGEGDGVNSAPTGGIFYGSQRTPLSLGSGGGRAGPGANGGAGGGAVAIRARSGLVTLKGTIDASGENGRTSSPGGGGGAGGSILVEGQTCNITGTLNAAGGNGGNDTFDGGGGGGGRVSILYTQGPCIATGTVTVASGTSSGGQAGQIGTFPTIASIPSTPSFKDQYKTDGETNIPVGGVTQELSVNLKASVSDPGANEVNPQSLVAEFEVVGLNESFTAANLLRGKIVPDYANTIFAGVYNAPEIEYSGGVPLVSEVNVFGLEPGGEYKWRARVLNEDTNVLGSWTEFGNNSSNQADFIVSSTVGLEISPNKTTVIVGEQLSLQVSAKNSTNDNDLTYRGTVTFSNTPSGNSILPSNYVFGESDNGTHEFTNQVTFTQPGNYTITVTDVNSGLSATTSNITVNLPPAAMNQIIATPSSTTVVQGESINLTVRAYDQYSDIYPNYTGTVTFGSTAGGTVSLPGNYAFTLGDNGERIFNNVVFNQVGTFTITVTDTSNGSITNTTELITVNPSIQSLSIVPSLTFVNAGDPISLTVSGLNGSSQPDSYYRGTITFASSAGEDAYLPLNYTFTGTDNGVHEFIAGLVFTAEGVYTVTVTDINNGGLVATTGPITVNPPLPQSDATTLELETENLLVLVGEPITVKAIARDEDGNIVSDYYSTVNFSSSASPDVTLPNNYQFSVDDSGVHEFENELIFAKAGEFTLTVKDILVDSLTDTLTFIVSKSTQSLRITPSSTSIRIGDSIDLTVDALNSQNSNDAFYKGTVGFSSTSSSAVLPAVYTFITDDSGRRTFANGARFVESGIYTISVQDQLDSSLTAVSANIIVNPNNICDEDPTQLICLSDIEITNIITEQLSPTSQRICWNTNIATVGTIQYGVASSETYSNTTEQETEYLEYHCVVINDLQPETQYIFKINATSNVGKNASEEGTFATINGELIPVSGARQCINNGNTYAFNSNGQVVLSFSTQEETICKVYYGNDSKNLNFIYSEDQRMMNHMATLDLSNLDGKSDMYYQISCASAQRTCVENVVVPLSKYLPYYPDQSTSIVVDENAIPIILTLATIATAAANVFSYPSMMLYAIPWFASRKRKSTWGVIYDDKTKEPIPFVAVRMYDSVGHIQKQLVTGFDGKYGFLVNKGSYILEIKHTEYNNEKLEIVIEEDEGIAAKNIGLVKTTGTNESFKNKLKKMRDKIRRNLSKINNYVVVVGFIVSIMMIITNATFFNYFVFSIYCIQFLILILLSRRNKDWGYVYDSESYNRIKSASVRVFDLKQGRQVDVQLTDSEGRFGFKLTDGEYRIQVNASGYVLDTNRFKGKLFKSPIGQDLVNITLKGGKQLNVELPMKKSQEAIGKFGM